MKNNSLYLESKVIADFLKNPVGYGISFADIISIYPVDECSPPQLWQVSYQVDNSIVNHVEFDDVYKAAYHFVELRHKYQYGLDYERW